MIDYRNFNDEELICRLHAGEEAIADYLLEKYKSFVKSKSRALFLVGGDREDLIQEGMIGLFKAMRDYAPEKNVPFVSFAKLCIERQMYTAIEAAGRLKNAPLNGYISLSEEEERLMDGGIEEAVIEKASYQQMYDHCVEEYKRKYGPMNHMCLTDAKAYQWLDDPWPWEYCKNKEA